MSWELGLLAEISAPTSDWNAPQSFPSLEGIKRISIDVEKKDEKIDTLGPGVYRGDSYIVGLALGIDDGPRFYFPVKHEGGGNLDFHAVVAWAKRELNEFGGEVVGARLVYDLESLAEEWGVTFPRVRQFHDVQIAEALLDEHRGRYNLDSLSWSYLQERKDEEMLRQFATGCGWSDGDVKRYLWRAPAKYVGPYGEGDVDRPLRILPLQLKRITDEGLERAYDLESRLIPVSLAMRRRGVKINQVKLDAVRQLLRTEHERLLQLVQSYAGQNATFMGARSLAATLQGLGFTLPSTAKKGEASITKTWLREHRADHPLVEAITTGRRVEKILSTYIDGLERYIVKGRVHPEWRQLKGDYEHSSSGDDDDGSGGTPARYSCAAPNLQNQPSPSRDPEYGTMMRAVYEPEEGEIWWRGDFSQVEWRWLATLARGRGSEEARRMYREDPATDFHVMLGNMFGVNASDKLQRGRIKNASFTKVFGGGYRKLAATVGCSEEEAKSVYEEYDRRLPFVKQTLRDATKAAEQQGFVRTVMGRRRRFPFWGPRYGRGMVQDYNEACERWGRENVGRAEAHAALSGVVQGSAAEHMKKAMVNGFEAGVFDVLGPYLVTVHDELGVSAPHTEAAEEALRELQYIMEHCMDEYARVPFRVETERGPSWGEVK